LPVRFIYPAGINIKSRQPLWVLFAQKMWSSGAMEFLINDDKSGIKDVNKINVEPWPSSFYIKRVSSHEWNVLTSPRTAAHEIGHLLGLADEYYETDKRVASKNYNRYIGSKSSIMRNVQSGYPQKIHIQFILIPIKCSH
ncbi:MAG: hypothetical protein V1647_02250, partial [Pseudomonadota bacterium]